MPSTSNEEVYVPFSAGQFGVDHRRPIGIERDF